MSAPAQPPAHPGALGPGAIFHGRYRVARVIKVGGMGAVYEVVDEKTSSPRALKIMLPGAVDNPDLRARFELEARVTASIESDHVVRVADAGIDEATSTPFLVMELLRGEELADLIAARRALPPSEVVFYLWQAALALDKTHASGIVHRDLKPENLFITRRDDGSPCVKILDFGIAKLVQGDKGKKTRALGTPVYMAPEQIKGMAEIGPRADLYTLGHIAYAALAGEAYWKEESLAPGGVYPFLAKIVAGAVEAPSARARRRTGAVLPPGFDAWFQKATAPRAEDRFDRATTLVTALSQATASPNAAASPAAVAGVDPAPPSRSAAPASAGPASAGPASAALPFMETVTLAGNAPQAMGPAFLEKAPAAGRAPAAAPVVIVDKPPAGGGAPQVLVPALMGTLPMDTQAPQALVPALMGTLPMDTQAPALPAPSVRAPAPPATPAAAPTTSPHSARAPVPPPMSAPPPVAAPASPATGPHASPATGPHASPATGPHASPATAPASRSRLALAAIAAFVAALAAGGAVLFGPALRKPAVVPAPPTGDSAAAPAPSASVSAGPASGAEVLATWQGGFPLTGHFFGDDHEDLLGMAGDASRRAWSLVAVDGTDFHVRWSSPGAGDHAPWPTQVAVVGPLVGWALPDGVRVLSLATGALVRTVAVNDAQARICQHPTDDARALYLGSNGLRASLDLQTGSVAVDGTSAQCPPLGQPGDTRARNARLLTNARALPRPPDGTTLLPVPGAPGVDTLALTEGGLGFTVARPSVGVPAPSIVAFGVTDRAVRWTAAPGSPAEPFAPVQALDAGGGQVVVLLSAGRTAHLAALDAASGALQWQAAVPCETQALRLGATRVYVLGRVNLHVFDRRSGQLLRSLGDVSKAYCP